MIESTTTQLRQSLFERNRDYLQMESNRLMTTRGRLYCVVSLITSDKAGQLSTTSSLRLELQHLNSKQNQVSCTLQGYRGIMEFTFNYHLGTGEFSAEKRYSVCQVFFDNQVPHTIWFEDALVHYGVPTVVFDLYVLVEDIDLAANFLAKAGWTFDMQKPHLIGNAEVDLVDFPQQRLISPDCLTRTVLLPATDWKFPLSSDTRLEYAPLGNKSTHNVPFPPLAGLLDALIDSWLDCPSDDAMLLIVLACQISYLYAHVPALTQESFAEQMKYEHRQFHFDVLAGMETGTLPFRRHQRAIRDAMLKRQYELRECSASRDNKDLFSFLEGVGSKPIEEEQQIGDALESAETTC